MKSPSHPVPQDLQNADALIARMGELQRDRKAHQIHYERAVEALKGPVDAKVAEIDLELSKLQAALQAFFEGRRTELTNGGKTKTVKLSSGAVSWRALKTKLRIDREDAAIIEACLNAGFERFVRTEHKISKEAMLAEPDVATTLTGVSIVSGGEQITIKPNEWPLEDVTDD